MSPFRSRRVVLVFAAFAVAVGSLLVPETALADTALFRAQQIWHNYPNPAVTTPGGAGLYQGYIQPYLTKTAMGMDYVYPAATAVVEPGNPIGGAFTLPQSFIDFSGTYWRIPMTGGWLGYTTIWYVDYYNGPGKFGPNHGATGPIRIVFPTTMGNPSPTYNGTLMKWTGGNFGYGDPVSPTTTFDGRYDMSRGGSISVTPGPRRFGGTLRLFYGPDAGSYQYIYYFDPAFYKQYGDYICFDEGKFGCTPSSFASDIGDTTATYQITRFLLNVTGTGTGNQTRDNTAKATTPTTPNGGAPTPYGNASFITEMQRYLNLIHPWTTGFARVHNEKGSPNIITPQYQGYDIDLLGQPKLTVTRVDKDQVWNKTLSTLTTTTHTVNSYLYGVGRVVSMVRPRLIHTYTVPIEPGDPIANTWQVARLWRLKVFFLPEPAGALLLSAGIAALLGLSRMRRH